MIFCHGESCTRKIHLHISWILFKRLIFVFIFFVLQHNGSYGGHSSWNSSGMADKYHQVRIKTSFGFCSLHRIQFIDDKYCRWSFVFKSIAQCNTLAIWQFITPRNSLCEYLLFNVCICWVLYTLRSFPRKFHTHSCVTTYPGIHLFREKTYRSTIANIYISQKRNGTRNERRSLADEINLPHMLLHQLPQKNQFARSMLWTFT